MILPAPMLLHQGKRVPPFAQPGWLYELKFDGYRLMAGVNCGEVRLATRNGADATKWFPEVAEGLATLLGGPHVLDGEVCVLDEWGRSDFARLQDRAHRRRWYEGCDSVVFCAFDLLARDGRSLIGLPVENRKAQLQKLLTPAPAGVLYVGHFDAEHGRELFEHAKELKLEGLVAKRLGSLYMPGKRSPDWVKCKVPGAVPPERFKQRPRPHR
jgi:bifunctional non-homologous end joining protein LigD